MSISQGQIDVSRGRIVSTTAFEGGVRVRTDTATREYPGGFIMPGFVDAHAHVVGLGQRLSTLALYDCRSVDACIQAALQHGQNRGEWITGMGWNQELWEFASMPTAKQLDEYFPATPVYLRRADGHAAWVNSEALRRSGIDQATISPPGGVIVRDASGDATGILVDNAMDMVASHLAPFTDDQIQAFIQQALRACSSKGLTEIHDMDVAPAYIPVFREMAERGELPTRIQSWVAGQHDEWLRAGILPAVGEFQRTVGVKFYADGALGSRGAALLEPYTDDPHNCGLLFLTDLELFTKAKAAIESGFNIATHAIGDAANRQVLRVYEQLRSSGIADSGVILRVEHAQIVHPDDRELFARADIRASVQPIHCVSDAQMAEKRLAHRCSTAYPWRSLLDRQAKLCAGSDFPIESHDPLLGIDAFCRRRSNATGESWYARECISRSEALAAYTYWAHDAVDVSYRRGHLREGYDADFVIWDTNLLTCSEDDVCNAKVVASYVAGTVQYEA